MVTWSIPKRLLPKCRQARRLCPSGVPRYPRSFDGQVQARQEIRNGRCGTHFNKFGIVCKSSLDGARRTAAGLSLRQC
jgi:hypothetical protein